MRSVLLLALVASAAGFAPPALPRSAAARSAGSASGAPALVALAARSRALVMQKEDGVRAGLVNEVPFEIRFSIGNVVSASGFALLLYCLISYLLSNGTADLLQTLGFVYAIPALVGGLALKYAELPPVPVEYRGESAASLAVLREAKGVKTQKKVCNV